jgi:hypothetical protein
MAAASAGEPPVIERIQPLGLAPGETATITVRGKWLSGACRFWSTWGTVAEGHSDDPSAIRIEWTVPSEADRTLDHRSEGGVRPVGASLLGLHAVRVATADGVSPLQAMLVDPLPRESEAGSHETAGLAQRLTTPCAVDGQIEELQRDWYRFRAPGGGLRIEVYARRLGSPLDPVIILYRADGRELAYADDTEGLGGDCQLAHESAPDEEYLLEVRDIRYRGSAAHVYWLRIGDFPLMNGPVPAAVQRGTADTSLTTVRFAGLSADDAAPVTVAVPAGWPYDWLPVATRRSGGTNPSFGTVSVVDRPVLQEPERGHNRSSQAGEPAEGEDVPQPIELGVTIVGRFDTPGDLDRYRFAARKGDRCVISGVTRQQGCPTDLVLELIAPDGTSVAREDDLGTEEGRLDHAFASDGEYTLVLSDLHRRGGSRYTYRVDVVRHCPGWSLAVDDHVNCPQGGIGAVLVSVSRQGYEGPIRLRAVRTGQPDGPSAAGADDAPESAGWESLPTIVGRGQNAAALTIRTATDMSWRDPAWEVAVVGDAVDDDARPLTEDGSAEGGQSGGTAGAAEGVATGPEASGGRCPPEPATVTASLRQRWQGTVIVAPQFARQIAVGGASPAPFALRCEPVELAIPAKGRGTLTIRVEGASAGRGEVALSTVPDKDALPKDVQLNLSPIPADADSVTLELIAGEKAARGPFTVVISGKRQGPGSEGSAPVIATPVTVLIRDP